MRPTRCCQKMASILFPLVALMMVPAGQPSMPPSAAPGNDGDRNGSGLEARPTDGGSSRQAAQRLDLALGSGDWDTDTKGTYSVRFDRRGVLTMSHADVAAENGSHATVSRLVLLPEGYKGPIVLRFYLTDDYVGDKEQPTFFRDGVKERISDWKEDVRFAQVLLDDVVVWSKDVLGRNGTTPGSRFYDLEMSELVAKKTEVKLSFRAQDQADTDGETFATDVFWARPELIWRYGDAPPPVEFPPRLPFRREKFRATVPPAPLSGSMTLTVKNPAGVALDAWPVRRGVPLPQGAITEATQVALRDAAGDAVQLQAEVLARWSDGSVKWLLLDFVALLAAEDTEYELTYGEDVEGATADRPEQSGPSANLAERFWLQPAGGESAAWRARPIGELEWRANGPVCVEHTRRVEYGPEGGAPVARGIVTEQSYDKSRIMLVRHTLEVGGQEQGLALREIGMQLPDLPEPDKPATVVQIAPDRMVADGVESEARWDGIARYSADSVVALRWPWQQFASGFRAGAERRGLLLYAEAEGGEPLHLAPGEAKTHEVLICPGEAAPGNDGDMNGSGLETRPTHGESSAQVNAVFQHPPVVVFEPGWIAATGVLGPFMGEDTVRFPEYEAKAASLAPDIASRRESQQAYGFEHFGDTQFKWGYGEPLTYWANTEYDHAHSLLWQFLRTGDPDCFYAGCQAAMHYRDVDLIHADDEHPDWIGGAHHHSETHTGHGPSISHHWTEGIFDHWLLTGDTRSLECGKQAAEYARRVAMRSGYGGGERDAGWNLIALMGAYRATGDESMLEAAKKKVDEVLQYLDPVRGVSSRPIYEQTAYEGGVPFMAGVLMRGLTACYEETRDERVGWAICGLCDWLECEMMASPGRFSYKQAPQLRHAGPLLLVLDGAAFAWNFTGDPAYRQLALDIYREGVGQAGLTTARDMPHALALLATALPPVSLASIERPLLVLSGESDDAKARLHLRNLSGEKERAQLTVRSLGRDEGVTELTVQVAVGEEPTVTRLGLPLRGEPNRAERFAYQVNCRDETVAEGEIASLVVRQLPRVVLLASEDNLTARALELLAIPHDRRGMESFEPGMLDDADVLLCGFDTSREPLAPYKEALAQWVRSGGVVLGFRDNSGANGWLPSPVKQDASYQPGEVLEPESGPLSLLHEVDAAELAAVHGGSMYRAFYDLGEDWQPLVSTGEKQAWDETEPASDGPHYGLIELRHGKGRIVLCQLIPEYAWLNDSAGRFDDAGRRLLENLIGYACLSAAR